jgi:activator of 2-hydroxyglutaryl-CoA dehydratase
MKFAGIDIGSRTIELVVVDDEGEITDSLQADTGFDPMTRAKQMISEISYDHIMATGYGRNLFEISFNAPTVTEIKAHAKGARKYLPDA